MRNYCLKWGVVTILSINCCPRLKHYPWNCAQPIVCLLSHNVITTSINLHLFCEICFWTLIEIFCFYTMFITFVRWRLSVGIKRFTYLLTYLIPLATAVRILVPLSSSSTAIFAADCSVDYIDHLRKAKVNKGVKREERQQCFPRSLCYSGDW